MENPIKSIYQWQVAAGLADRNYNSELEASFQIEEALEGFDVSVLASDYGVSGSNLPKEISRAIVAKTKTSNLPNEISEVEAFDKAIDAIVFAIGAMAKLKLTPQQMQRGMLGQSEYSSFLYCFFPF